MAAYKPSDAVLKQVERGNFNQFRQEVEAADTLNLNKVREGILTEAVLRNIGSAIQGTGITRINVAGNEMKRARALALVENLPLDQVQEMFFTNNLFQLKDAAAIAEKLPESVKVIDFSGNMFAPDDTHDRDKGDAKRLGEAFNGKRLTYIGMANSHLSVPCLLAFLNALKGNNIQLNISECEIDGKYAKSLAAAVKRSQLKELIADGNYLTAKSFPAFLSALQGANLTGLSVEDNGIEWKQGWGEWLFRSPTKAAQACATALAGTNLCWMKLEGNTPDKKLMKKTLDENVWRVKEAKEAVRQNMLNERAMKKEAEKYAQLRREGIITEPYDQLDAAWTTVEIDVRSQASALRAKLWQKSNMLDEKRNGYRGEVQRVIDMCGVAKMAAGQFIGDLDESVKSLTELLHHSEEGDETDGAADDFDFETTVGQTFAEGRDGVSALKRQALDQVRTLTPTFQAQRQQERRISEDERSTASTGTASNDDRRRSERLEEKRSKTPAPKM